ncbi:MAG TPA: hypothetical protein VFW33_21430, partial [Gemmataceae bacterium]|nr:hypothetical protein [Gemmataceae bacterium]
MNVEGIAFWTVGGKSGYLALTFSDEVPGTGRGIPVAIVRGKRIGGGEAGLVRALFDGRPLPRGGRVGVYVGPHTTDLEINFLWIAGFRPRKVRIGDTTAVRGHWELAACRH